jgi:hypothetical protein
MWRAEAVVMIPRQQPAMRGASAGPTTAPAPQNPQQAGTSSAADTSGSRPGEAIKPDAAVSEQQEASAASTSGAGACPFLAALPLAPKSSLPWWKSLYLQFTDLPRFQRETLGPNKVVQVSGSAQGHV